MSALPPGWTPERPSPLPVTPSSIRFRRPEPPSSHNLHSHVPVTPSPLSPFSTTPPQAVTSFFNVAPPKTPRQPSAFPGSHYYRAPRSAMTSPCRSNFSSPSVSPTRSGRRSRIQALLATDPLLSRLTPSALREMANDPELGFTAEERAWSMRASEGITRVGEWLREVEGWNIAWGRGSKNGDGYLPPEPGTRRKRRKMSLRTESVEEMRPIVEEEGESLVGSLGSYPNTNEPDSPTPGSSGGPDRLGDLKASRGGKPLTSMQIKMQKRAAVAMTENEGSPPRPSTPPKQTASRSIPEPLAARANGSRALSTPVHGQHRGVKEDLEDEDDEINPCDYYGSLTKTTVAHYEQRIEAITEGVEELDVEGLKGKVLSYRTGIENPLTSSSAVIAATTLQLLPPLHRLMKLLSIWAIRLAVLKIVPVFLRWLGNARDALDAGYETIQLPAIADGSQKLDEEIFAVMAENIQQRVTAAGRIMDSMLDALEGREDVLPDKWVGELEDIEEGVSNWEMDAERVVLEGRLREVSKAEEFRNEREKMHLVMEGERVAEKAREDENAVEDVLEKVGELERGLMEALEAQEDVTEGIEIEGQTSESELEDEVPIGLGLDKSLLKRLREVQSSEIEADRGRRWRRASSIGSLAEAASSPIKSPDIDMGQLRNEAENREGIERRSFFDSAFGERLRGWSVVDAKQASPSPSIVVTGFDVPKSPRGTTMKEVSSPEVDPLTKKSHSAIEKQVGSAAAALALLTSGLPVGQGQGPLVVAVQSEKSGDVSFPDATQEDLNLAPAPANPEIDESEQSLTPPLGFGELAVQTPTSVVILPGTPESVDQEVVPALPTRPGPPGDDKLLAPVVEEEIVAATPEPETGSVILGSERENVSVRSAAETIRNRPKEENSISTPKELEVSGVFSFSSDEKAVEVTPIEKDIPPAAATQEKTEAAAIASGRAMEEGASGVVERTAEEKQETITMQKPVVSPVEKDRIVASSQEPETHSETEQPVVTPVQGREFDQSTISVDFAKQELEVEERVLSAEELVPALEIASIGIDTRKQPEVDSIEELEIALVGEQDVSSDILPLTKEESVEHQNSTSADLISSGREIVFEYSTMALEGEQEVNQPAEDLAQQNFETVVGITEMEPEIGRSEKQHDSAPMEQRPSDGEAASVPEPMEEQLHEVQAEKEMQQQVVVVSVAQAPVEELAHIEGQGQVGGATDKHSQPDTAKEEAIFQADDGEEVLPATVALEWPVVVAVAEEKLQHTDPVEGFAPAREVFKAEAITEKQPEAKFAEEHAAAQTTDRAEKQVVPIDLVKPSLASIDKNIKGDDEDEETEETRDIAPVEDMASVEEELEVKEQDLAQANVKSDGQPVDSAVSIADDDLATTTHQVEEAAPVSALLATAGIGHITVAEVDAAKTEAVPVIIESTTEMTSMLLEPVQAAKDEDVDTDTHVVASAASTEIGPIIARTVQEVSSVENMDSVTEVEKTKEAQDEGTTVESVQREPTIPTATTAAEHEAFEKEEEFLPAVLSVDKLMEPATVEAVLEAFGIDGDVMGESAQTAERTISPEPCVQGVPTVETPAVGDVEEMNKSESQVILSESVETPEENFVPLSPKQKNSSSKPGEAKESILETTSTVENVLEIQSKPEIDALPTVIDENETPSKENQEPIADSLLVKLSHVQSSRLMFEGLAKRAQPAEPVTPVRGASIRARKEAFEDPAVLAIGQAIEEFSRPNSGQATPISDENGRFTPSPDQLHASLLPSVFGAIPDFGEVGRDANLDCELGEAFVDIDDDVLSDFDRAIGDDDDLDFDASMTSDIGQFHIGSSPPKFELSSPMLPSPPPFDVNGSPFTPHHGHNFLNASTPGDDSFTRFDDFEAHTSPTNAPPPPPPPLGRRNKAHDLPSIMESRTPRSMQEEWGSHAKKFLGGHPMQASRSKSPSDGRGDGSVKFKSKERKPARKQIQSLFTNPPPASEASDGDASTTLPEVDGAHVLLPTSGKRGMWKQATLNQTYGLDSSPASASDFSGNEPTFSRDSSPDYDIPTGPAIRLPKRGGARPHQSYSGAITPDKRQHDRPWLENSIANLPDVPKGPSTPPPRDLDIEMDERINELLMSLPRKVKLTVSNLQKLNDLSKKPSSRLWQSNIPAPKSAVTASSGSQPGHAKINSRRHNTSAQGDIKCYHLHRNDDQPPMKLFVRLVGNARLVCRVGGGWSDLEEYLKEWALHHGSKMRAVSESVLQIEEIPSHKAPSGQPNQRNLRHSTSNSSMGQRRRSPTPNGYLRSLTPTYGSRPGSSCGECGKKSASPMFSITAAPQRSTSANVSPMLLPGQPESPSQASSRRGGSLGPSPMLKTPTSDGFSGLGLTPSPPSGPSRPASRGPPSGSRPGSSGSSFAGIRRQTSRLFSESAVEDRPPLGLAGPRGGGKNVTPEHQAWVEGMIGQVRRVSGSRAIHSSASDLGGSVGGSVYGGSVFGDEESPPELRPPSQTRPHSSLGRPQTRPHSSLGRPQTRPHSSLGRPQTSLGRPSASAVAASAGRRRSGSASSVTAPGSRRSGGASLVQAQREHESPREQSGKDSDSDMARPSPDGARAVGQIQVPKTRPSVGGVGTGETRRVYLKRGDGGAVRGGTRRTSRGGSALPRPSSRLE